MATKVESHSSGAEESMEEEVGSPTVSVGSSSSGFSYNPVIDTKSNETTLPTTRTHLPLLVQKEMSKLFAARCDATQLDLIPFKVVMDIIREHFILSNKPELLRVLIRLLCQYQPLQGEKEYRKLISLCEDLLVTVDEEVREAFLTMIPAPLDYRQNFHPQTNVMGCGHFIRNSGRKEDDSNPLAELVKRPLLSYQTMPAPLFQQPFLKPTVNIQARIGNPEPTKDSYKYLNFSTNAADINKPDYEILNKTPAHASLGHSSWMGSVSGATALPMTAGNSSMMWFARAASQSPLHSPTSRHQGASSRHPLLTANISSLVPNLSNYNQYETNKKQQLFQRKQELIKNIESLTKMKNFENAITADISVVSHDPGLNTTLLPPSFPLSCLTAPNYCGSRIANSNNLDLSRHPCTITNDIAACCLENRIDQDNSCYLEQLLKRPETPDCSNPWGNGKKPRRQNKPCPINSLMSRKKKKSKK